ncbi:MAG TPA: TonB-dependent receptor [Opitutaceae bacterium]|nr:TonB-dependent receptor [Opitutaceae bacterium]
MKPHQNQPARSRLPLLASAGLFLLSSALLQAQLTAPDAATLAKYDTNKNGRLDADETAAMDAAQKSAATAAAGAAATNGASSASGEAVMLSPFEVVSDANGYYQANSISGTRLNSKIEDIGQSITVMTKEQMRDFAMLDINDVFDYMASTEGIGSYSQFDTDRTGAVVDQVSLNPNNANRVRSIGNANIAFNNIQTSGRVPVDPLWMDSLELSRGPNANIFGLGLASGTVNQVPATANTGRDFSRVEIRGDSYDGWRVSFDANRVLIKNKLAVRASYANQHTGFVRKPSGEDSRRLSAQLKYRPFQNTTLALSWYNYKNASVRPNFTTPRDYYTDWFRLGQPGWNPVTRLVTLADGRVMGLGNVVGSTTPYTATPSFYAGADSRSPFQIGAPGEAPYWTMARYTSNPATPAGNNFSVEDPFASASAGIGLQAMGPSETYTATQQPLYNTVARPINNKAIYDYSKINLAGNGKAWDDVDTYMAQLDQIIINTRKQTLAAQLTYMREDSKRLENQPFGPASVNSNVGQLQVDVNQVYLDGTPNPYFGRPYLKSSEPFLRNKPLLWETSRAQAAYRIDFTQDKGLTKWLGSQQLLGYYEYKDQKNFNYNYRHTALGMDKAWMQKYAGRVLATQTVTNVDPKYLIPSLTAGGAPTASNNYARLAEQYYVGSTPGGPVQYAPSLFPENASVAYVWGPNSGSMFKDASPVGFTPAPGGGLQNLNSIVKTKGGVLQSTFLNNKLVGTFGMRQDTVNDRNSPLATLTADARAYDFGPSDTWVGPWRVAKGKTKFTSVVARPFQDLRYFRSEDKTGVRRFLSQAVSGLSLTYNKADNFVAQGPAFDLFLKPLPNQTGTSKEYGFWLTLLDGKLSVRYNHFDTKQLDLRNGDISTMAQRILRYEGFVASDSYNLRSQASSWLRGVGTNGTATNEEIAAAIKMPIEQYNGLQKIAANSTYAAVNDAQSKGHELEINFNPNRYWTVSASVTKTQAMNIGAGAAVDDYIAARMPIWTTLEDPRFTQTTQTINGVTTAYTPTTIPTGATGHLLWWNILGAQFNSAAGYNATQSAALNFTGNVDAPMSVFRALIGRPLPQQRKYSAKFNTRYNLAGISDNKFLKNTSVGGSVRYSSKGSIGFYGLGYTQGMDLTLPANRITQLDTNRPIYSGSEVYVDLLLSYRTKLYRDKVGATFQLNVKNVQESGVRLQKTAAFFDGRTSTYRIVDPRQFILTASFDL